MFVHGNHEPWKQMSFLCSNNLALRGGQINFGHPELRIKLTNLQLDPMGSQVRDATMLPGLLFP